VKILIVEDELVIANFMKEILDRADYNVLTPVRNYEEAISSFHKYSPDLILLDINLSNNISGFKIAEKIKESTNTAIILVSANSSPEFISQAKELNPNGFLSKPVKPVDLLMAVELAYNSFVKNSEMNNEIMSLASKSLISEQAVMLKSFIHDMINPMTSLKHEVSTSKSLEVNEKAKLKEKVDIVIELLKSFRVAVKESKGKAGPIRIPSLCKKIDLINRYHCLSHDIDLMITPLEENIYGSESDLVRIFSNLINNSIDAIKDNGDDDKWIDITFTKIGEKIKVLITDSGHGVLESHREHLFKSKYTTKSESLNCGSGLGLYSAKEVLERFRHTIHYNSRSENTQFVIDFFNHD